MSDYYPVLIAFLISLFIMISPVDSHAAYSVMTKAEQAALDRTKRQAAGQLLWNQAFKQNAPVNSRAPLTLSRPVSYSPAGLKNLLSLKSLTPGGLALGAAFTAAGYIYDEVSGDVVTESGVAESVPTNAEQYCAKFFCQASQLSQCNSWTGSEFCWSTGTDYGNGDLILYIPSSTSANCPGGTFNATTNQCEAPALAPISDEELLTDVAPLITWDDVAFDDAGQPITTPELTQTLDNVNNWFTENYTDNSQTITTTSTSTTIINQDGSETTTGTESQDLPAFCNWAGIVCDLANWITEPSDLPADVPLPEKIVEEVDYVSSLPSDGVCPADIQIVDHHGQTINYSYTPQCQFATSLRPLVISAALMFSAVILLGLRT